MPKKIQFQGFNAFIKQIRSDRGWRIEIDVAENMYDVIKDIPKLGDKLLNITIEDTGV